MNFMNFFRGKFLLPRTRIANAFARTLLKTNAVNFVNVVNVGER
jgi:hypothetical protein